MTESRKRLIARIAQVHRHLEGEQRKVQQFKSSLHDDHPVLMTSLVLAPAVVVGWQMGNTKNVGAITNRIVEMGLMAATTQFKNQLNSFFSTE